MVGLLLISHADEKLGFILRGDFPNGTSFIRIIPISSLHNNLTCRLFWEPVLHIYQHVQNGIHQSA